MYKTCIVRNQLNRKVLFYFSAMCPHPDLLENTGKQCITTREGGGQHFLVVCHSHTTYLIKPLDPP